MKTQALVVSLVVGIAGLGSCGGGGSPAPAASFAGLGFVDGVHAIEAKVCACTDQACLDGVGAAVPAWWDGIQASKPADPSAGTLATNVDRSLDHIETCWAAIEAGATLTRDGQPWRTHIEGEGMLIAMRGSRNALCACRERACVQAAQETMMKEMMSAAALFQHVVVTPASEAEQLASEMEACVAKATAK